MVATHIKDTVSREVHASGRTDEELLAEYVETGNTLAFEEIVHRYERDLYGFLLKYLGASQLAEEAFQNTLLQLHLKCRQFEPGRRLRPWLYVMAQHKATDLMRRNRRHRAVSLDTGGNCFDDSGDRQSPIDLLEAQQTDPGDMMELAENRRKVRSAVEKLPHRLNEIIRLVVFQGMTHREAADALKIPLGTVKSRMTKAMETLYEVLITVQSASPKSKTSEVRS